MYGTDGVGGVAKSLPLWECGLKLNNYISNMYGDLVTPLVGVWIEIFNTSKI